VTSRSGVVISITNCYIRVYFTFYFNSDFDVLFNEGLLVHIFQVVLKFVGFANRPEFFRDVRNLSAMSGKRKVVYPDSTVCGKKKRRRWFSLYFAQASVLANNIIAFV